jgi:hypothetical protein
MKNIPRTTFAVLYFKNHYIWLLYFTQGRSTILNFSVLAETFYPGFITCYVYAPCIYIMGFCGLLLIFVYAALVNTTHGLIGYGIRRYRGKVRFS